MLRADRAARDASRPPMIFLTTFLHTGRADYSTRSLSEPRGARLMLFGEVFNLFNTANLVNYGGNLLEPSTFGQPAGRFSQVFGSGGPRAFQVGTRLSF